MPTSVINQAGPMPITVTIQPEVTGPAMLSVSGSVWTEKANTMIGIEVIFDDAPVGQAQIFSNGPSTHRTVITEYIQVSLDKPWTVNSENPEKPPTPASYTVTLRPMNADTVSDTNDQYSVNLFP